MKYKFKLSNISKLGLGCWGLGGDSYGKLNEQRAIQLIKFAVKKKINFFDTSNIYGAGKSEIRIGKALKNLNRQKLFLASKIGMMPHKPTQWRTPQNFNVNYLKKSFFQSLSRLDTDYLDLIQLHSPPVDVLKNKTKMKKILILLKTLKNKGLVNHLGVSVKSPNDAVFVIKNYKDFKFIQLNFNLMDQRAIDFDVFNLALSKNVNIISRTPLAFGFLSGKVKFKKKDDHRKKWDYKQINIWQNGMNIFKNCITRKKMNIHFLALLFSVFHKSIIATIPGMMSEKEIIQNCNFLKLKKLNKKEVDSVRLVYKENNWIAK